MPIREQGIENLKLQFEDRLIAVGHKIAGSAIGFAPRGKKNGRGSASKPLAVEIEHAEKRALQPVGGADNRVFAVRTRQPLATVGPHAFKFAPVPKASKLTASQSRSFSSGHANTFPNLELKRRGRPSTTGEKRGRLTGNVTIFGKTGRDAHIASSIRVSEVEDVSEHRLRIEVRAHAKHSYYQEQGFDHKGGHHVVGQHYMLKGLEANRADIESGLKG